MKTLVIFGASGHAKVVVDVVEKQGLYRIAFMADDDQSLTGLNVMGYTVVGGRNSLIERSAAAKVRRAIVAIGHNAHRMAVAEWLTSRGFRLVSAVHPSARLAREVTVAENTVIMAGAVVNPGAVIGRSVIVNTGAIIDHDCRISDGVHIGPGCSLCGSVRVGRGSLVGAGSTIIPGISVGRESVLGAGSVVVSDIPENSRAKGSPCKPY